MQPIKNVKRSFVVISVGIGLSLCGGKALAQPPQGPPPPPPNPIEVFKKINPFKKKDKSKSDKSTDTPPSPGNAPGNPPSPGNAPATAPGGPPPPPNPLDLFKKKKKDTVKRAAPAHQS